MLLCFFDTVFHLACSKALTCVFRYLLKMKGLQRHQAGDVASATRFFHMAIEKCEESLNSNPNHKLTLRNCGQLITFVDGALDPGKRGEGKSPILKRADRYGSWQFVVCDISSCLRVFSSSS